VGPAGSLPEIRALRPSVVLTLEIKFL
jgi:hypothetical protein